MKRSNSLGKYILSAALGLGGLLGLSSGTALAQDTPAPIQENKSGIDDSKFKLTLRYDHNGNGGASRKVSYPDLSSYDTVIAESGDYGNFLDRARLGLYPQTVEGIAHLGGLAREVYRISSIRERRDSWRIFESIKDSAKGEGISRNGGICGQIASAQADIARNFGFDAAVFSGPLNKGEHVSTAVMDNGFKMLSYDRVTTTDTGNFSAALQAYQLRVGRVAFQHDIYGSDGYEFTYTTPDRENFRRFIGETSDSFARRVFGLEKSPHTGPQVTLGNREVSVSYSGSDPKYNTIASGKIGMLSGSEGSALERALIASGRFSGRIEKSKNGATTLFDCSSSASYGHIFETGGERDLLVILNDISLGYTKELGDLNMGLDIGLQLPLEPVGLVESVIDPNNGYQFFPTKKIRALVHAGIKPLTAYGSAETRIINPDMRQQTYYGLPVLGEVEVGAVVRFDNDRTGRLYVIEKPEAHSFGASLDSEKFSFGLEGGMGRHTPFTPENYIEGNIGIRIPSPKGFGIELRTSGRVERWSRGEASGSANLDLSLFED